MPGLVECVFSSKFFFSYLLFILIHSLLLFFIVSFVNLVVTGQFELLNGYEFYTKVGLNEMMSFYLCLSFPVYCQHLHYLFGRLVLLFALFIRSLWGLFIVIRTISLLVLILLYDTTLYFLFRRAFISLLLVVVVPQSKLFWPFRQSSEFYFIQNGVASHVNKYRLYRQPCMSHLWYIFGYLIDCYEVQFSSQQLVNILYLQVVVL